MPRSRRLKLYEYVQELVDAGTSVLAAQLQLPPEQARQVALAIARDVCFRNAKSTVYIPEAANLANLERNAAIWAAYQADNLASGARKFTPQRAIELAAEHDLSPQQIYNILRGERESELAAVQSDWVGTDPVA